MTVLEDSTDLSWVQNRNTRFIGEMLSCTDVGLLRDQLNEELTQSLVDEFVDPAADGSVHEGIGEESIFDYGSPMGLLPDAEGDRWMHDHAASTWTRVIVIPCEKYFHPDEDRVGGPALEDLGDLRKTITSDGRIIQDNWRKAEMDGGPGGDSKEWIGSCIFHETWSAISEDRPGVGQIDRATGTPGNLVFTNVPEYSVVDNLTGEDPPASLVTIAKREEITEMYRRAVWKEELVEDCYRDIGKPPIPVRWVVMNKGDRLHPNIRCRLVATHLVAKYGG